MELKNNRRRKQLVFLSLFINLGVLGLFKYYNFFVESFTTAFSFFGSEVKGNSLNIILPVGISFYTFQTLSYTIDVYKNKLTPTKDFIAFASFVSFFPQLVAGPIEKAKNLLPQFHKKRVFSYQNATDGLRQILWGLFKKVVIADSAAEYANFIFNYSEYQHGSTLVIGALFFAFQIYGDFSGYSDIAIGTSRLFGFNLMQNFNFPYFSRDIAEFWRKWHISLSSWFRDYLYIPLGGSRVGTLKKIRNIFIIFIVSGFWHGANWTFIIWGALNALYFLPLLLNQKNRKNLDTVANNSVLPTIKEFTKIIFTFTLTVFAWIFFRADNISHASQYVSEIFSESIIEYPYFHSIREAVVTFFWILGLITIEWFGRNNKHALETFLVNSNKLIRYVFYYVLIFAIFWYSGKEHQFIYFQF
jgi:D-alanyl-lipoteichoic acid acyltransferase DltB (MBOAT superfamily)